MASRCTRFGFTLVELMLVAAMIGILTAVAAPHMRALLDSVAVRGAANDAVAILSQARLAAITRGIRTTVEVDTTRCSFVLRAGPETLASRDESPNGVRCHATRAAVSYLPLGITYGVSNLTLTMTRGAAVETVTVSRLGRVRE